MSLCCELQVCIRQKYLDLPKGGGSKMAPGSSTTRRNTRAGPTDTGVSGLHETCS